MAIEKEIELENGIVLNYHRISSLNKITNMSNNLEINSYLNDNQREKERHYQDLQKRSANNEILSEEEQEELEKGINVLVEAEFISIPYDEEMTIEDAYEYLKTIENMKMQKMHRKEKIWKKNYLKNV